MRGRVPELQAHTSTRAVSPPETPRAAVFWGVIGSGLAGQWLLMLPPRGGAAEWLGNAVAIVLPVSAALTAWRWLGWRWLLAAGVTGAIGGLGMAAGGWLDRMADPTIELCLAPGTGSPARAGPLQMGWTAALMLGGCLAAGRWLGPRAPGGSRWQVWTWQAGCVGAMGVGMVLGGRLLLGTLASMMGPTLAMHAAMVIGMMAGTAALHWAIPLRLPHHEP